MQTIDVSMHFQAPLERVWELMSNHEGYTFIWQVSSAKLLQEGHSEKNGVGAVRKLRVLGATFIEEIVVFDPPDCLEYRVKKFTLPIRHEIGRIEFTSHDNGTDIHWVSRFELPIPIFGRILEPIFRLVMRRIFVSGLKQGKAKLEV